ncbi:MAG TPA: hypothetical protein VF530_18580 [Planctomycetota bacterium]
MADGPGQHDGGQARAGLIVPGAEGLGPAEGVPAAGTRRRRALLLWLGASLALLAGYRWNAWGAAYPEAFATTQRDTEGLVFGRLLDAEAHGFLAHGALLGFAGELREDLLTFDSADLWARFTPEAQRLFYLQGARLRAYGPYLTHSGLQGSAFVLLDRALGFLSRPARLEVFATLQAALVAAAYAALAAFLWHELGLGAALGALLVAGASPWLTCFAPNLYFSIWLFWLPGLALGWALRDPARAHEGRRLFLASFLGFLPRMLAGLEFMTATASLAAAPILYLSLRDQVGARAFLRRTLVAGAASALALVLSLGLLAFQIRALTGSFEPALQHIQHSWARRAGNDPSGMPPVYAEAMRTELRTVLRFYLTDPFDRDYPVKPPVVRWFLARTPAELGLAMLAAAAWLALRTRRLPSAARRSAVGLLVAVAAALAGVLAWLVVFKAHSALHPHVNPLLWHLGFLVLGGALGGWALEDGLRALRRRPERAAAAA